MRKRTIQRKKIKNKVHHAVRNNSQKNDRKPINSWFSIVFLTVIISFTMEED